MPGEHIRGETVNADAHGVGVLGRSSTGTFDFPVLNAAGGFGTDPVTEAKTRSDATNDLLSRLADLTAATLIELREIRILLAVSQGTLNAFPPLPYGLSERTAT